MRIGALLMACLILLPFTVRAQEPEIVRPEPPPREDFETDENGDRIPDGWYNLRDAKLAEGGIVGPTCFRFENDLPGRPARASRAFGIDGRKYDAVVLGLWVRTRDVKTGERMAEDPALLLDMLNPELNTTGRGILGPWKSVTVGETWAYVAKRIPVPEDSRDAILSVGLMGATGVLEIDGLTIELIPRGGTETTNLVLNGGFELGDPDPTHWVVNGGAQRTFPGHDSDAALELPRSGSSVQTGVTVPVRRFRAVEVRLEARGDGLRGAGGASAALYYLDDEGKPLPGASAGSRLFRWSGSFGWRPFRQSVGIPARASWAVLQIDKPDANGRIAVDDVQIVAVPDPQVGTWTPYHVHEETDDWKPYEAVATIEPGSALDASALLDAPAGSHGRVVVREDRLHFEDGTRARFFGVVLLPPVEYLPAERTDALADRLARSGVNLVRLGDLDLPMGPGRSLFDDSRDDTKALDPLALKNLDHLIAALRRRGIYYALELQSGRRFRKGDALEESREFPPGGGPAAAFDPEIRSRAMDAAKQLLGHVNPETGLALKDDPALAWITLAGELSLFNLIDDPSALPASSAARLREQAKTSHQGAGRRLWRSLEGETWTAEADELRAFGVKAPIAGSSHWRREADFVAAQAVPGLDLIDDRLYWGPPIWSPSERRSLLWDVSGGLTVPADTKRKTDRPYAVGQWANHTGGAWALPYEGAEFLMAARTALTEDWDALVRRGVFPHPEVWGANATGTGSKLDVFVVPEAINGNPQIIALLPHAASILLRGGSSPEILRRNRTDPLRGRLVVDTPYTKALAGWPGARPETFESLTLETTSPYAVVAVSALGSEPIEGAKRLLITVIARSEPTGLTWADAWRRDVADPGRPPMLLEPARAEVTWNHSGTIRAYALDTAGHRTGEAQLEHLPDGVRLDPRRSIERRPLGTSCRTGALTGQCRPTFFLNVERAPTP